MASVHDLNIPVVVTVRPLWIRMVRFPFVARQHYVVMRRHGHSVWLSVSAAWILASYTVRIGNSRSMDLVVR